MIGCSTLNLDADTTPNVAPDGFKAHVIVVGQLLRHPKVAANMRESAVGNIGTGHRPSFHRRCDDHLGSAIHPCYNPLMAALGLGQRADEIKGPVGEGLFGHRMKRFRHAQAAMSRGLGSCASLAGANKLSDITIQRRPKVVPRDVEDGASNAKMPHQSAAPVSGRQNR